MEEKLNIGCFNKDSLIYFNFIYDIHHLVRVENTKSKSFNEFVWILKNRVTCNDLEVVLDIWLRDYDR